MSRDYPRFVIHPLDYGDFEGRIPEGSYGAGAVIVWVSTQPESVLSGRKIEEL